MEHTRPDSCGLVVAIDGPSGSGKSSVSRGVASALGLRYLDTGAMYRAMTWWMLQHEIDLTDAAQVAVMAAKPNLVVGTDPAAPTITVDGTDVSGPIRSTEVTAAVSAVSAVPEVRQLLVASQRQLIGAGSIVVEGRDIGTVVAPQAPLKVYLTASNEARARRRNAELAQPTALEATRSDLDRRDRLDSGRTASPLAQAADAIVVDSTELTLDQVVERIVALAGAVPA